LRGGVDVCIRVCPGINDRQDGLVSDGEATVWLIGPLHRGAHGITFFQGKIISHTNLIAVTDNRSAGQGEQQAIRRFELRPVSEH
jgi:hypothetical protein